MIKAALLCIAFSSLVSADGTPEQQIGGNGGLLKVQQSGDSAGDIHVPPPRDGMDLHKPNVVQKETLPRLCGFDRRTAGDDIRMDDIRAISDKYCAAGNPSSNSYGLTNMVWAFGQFIDHDIVGTIEDTDGPEFKMEALPGKVMKLHRVKASGSTRLPPNIHTSLIDGGAVYGAVKQYENTILRERSSCRLRESAPGYLPVSTSPNATGKHLWIAGDSRVDEHAPLTTMHTLWMREHNRLCDKLEKDPKTHNLSNFRKYNMAKGTVIAKIQQITVNEWLPAFGISKRMLKKSEGKVYSDRVSIEFSVAYRLGHTIIPDKMAGMRISDLFDAQAFFLNQKGNRVSVKADTEAKMEKILKGLATEPSAEMDGRMSDSLRNVLFGPTFQEDLASRNIFRGRDLNLPSYASIAKCFGVTPDSKTQSQTPDAWIGLLREPRKPGQPLGPTHKAMMVEQFGRILYGWRGMWWQCNLKRETEHFKREISRTSMAQVISDNFNVKLSGNVFQMNR